VLGIDHSFIGEPTKKWESAHIADTLPNQIDLL
jgi:hypothetical protein